MSELAPNFPFYDVVKAADKQIKLGANVYQKFTCSHCGARQTMDVPNKFYETGHCEECKQITNIKLAGCNMLVHFQFPRK